jgi:hypothetical protein
MAIHANDYTPLRNLTEQRMTTGFTQEWLTLLATYERGLKWTWTAKRNDSKNEVTVTLETNYP